MDRKGQGISVNVIVIAAIALLILVILSVLVLRSGRSVNEGTQCEALGGTCRAASEFGSIRRCDTDNGEFADAGGFCPAVAGERQYCCRRL